MLKKWQSYWLINKKAFSLIILGSISWSITMVKSGLYYPFGMGFWGPNGHDGIWHIALSRSIVNGINSGSLSNVSLMPVFSGEHIKNYHVGFDLLLALLSKITGISLIHLYFQIIPVFLAFAIGLAVYTLVYKWKNSHSAALWSTFFVYFGGNFGWIVTYLRDRQLGGESMFWSQQSVSTLLNPPFALSLLVLLLALMSWKREKLLTSTILFGVLIQIKAYVGVIVLPALFVAGLYEFYTLKRLFTFKVFLQSIVLSIALFIPLNLRSAGLLEFKPLWFLETMMAFPDRLGWAKFGEAMVNYKLAGNIVKGAAAYGVAFVIFWYGNMGTRFLGELSALPVLKKHKKLDTLSLIIYLIIIEGFIASMLFVQKGTPWNTIQFFYYSLFFSGMMAGITVSELLKARARSFIWGVSLVALTIPTTFATLKHYLPSRPPAMITYDELSALKFLEGQPKGNVLVMPFDSKKAEAAISNPPRPLYLYESTSYVSAFTGKPVWLEDEVNLDITGFSWQERKGRLEALLRTNDKPTWDNFLERESISYIYVTSTSQPIDILGAYKMIFANGEVKIFTHTLLQ